MSTIAIVQSCYLPWRGYFDLIRRADQFILYDCVQYTDRDWRNRNRIKTAQGPHWLTVPVHAGRQMRICDVQCADMAWRARHWDTIRHHYARAPFFETYAPAIERLYSACEAVSLSQVNLHFLQGLCQLMGIRTPIHVLSEHIAAQGDKTDKLLAVCRHFGATHYLSGPSAQSYLDMAQFQDAGIEVMWMNYGAYVPYTQLYPPFDPQVSMIDTLLCLGDHWADSLGTQEEEGECRSSMG